MRARLFQLFVVGCVVSLIASGRLSVRLVAGGMIGWVLIPIVEAAIAATARPRAPIDALGRPVLLWLTVVAAIVSFLPPVAAFVLTSNTLVSSALAATAVAVLVIPQPRETVWLRLAVWGIVLVALLGLAAWPIVADPLGL